MEKTGINISATQLMVGSLATIIGLGLAVSLGASSGSVESSWTLFWLYILPAGTLVVFGLVADHCKNTGLKQRIKERRNAFAQIASRYNAMTDRLEQEYRYEKSALGIFDSFQKEKLRSKYEQEYEQNRLAFNYACEQYIKGHLQKDPVTDQFKKYWKCLIAIGMLTQFIACGFTVGSIPGEDSEIPSTHHSTLAQEEQATYWNADNLPIPHLTDGSRYVSNPDNVVTSNTEALLNRLLKRLDDSLLIESVMIIVNHVENDDPFRVAQDLFDKYKIGKNDRGLVIILAYQDHKVRTHTGRSLEADLTDIECSRLQQTYAIPFMKSEQPDSGMLYLTEAIYNTLQKKELPLTYAQQQEAIGDELMGIVSLYMFLFGGWLMLIVYLYNRYNGISARSLFHANPFAKAPVVIIGGGGGHGGGGFGRGGFGGGGFSGGSSGGGGATSSW